MIEPSQIVVIISSTTGLLLGAGSVLEESSKSRGTALWVLKKTDTFLSDSILLALSRISLPSGLRGCLNPSNDG